MPPFFFLKVYKMALTLIKVVQKTLNDMDSFPVNSISDTEESMQVASIAEDKFYALMNRSNWEHFRQIGVLVNTPVQYGPTTLQLSDSTDELKDLRYNGKRLTRVEIDEFLDRVLTKPTDLTDYAEVSIYGDVVGYVSKVKDPDFYTVFEDYLVVCDSYNYLVESRLQGSKTVVDTITVPTFVMDNTYEIPIPQRLESLYLAEVRAACFKKLKQATSDEDERDRRIQMSRMRIEEKRVADNDRKTKNQGFGRR